MKTTHIHFAVLLTLVVAWLTACQQEEYSLNTDMASLGALEGPVGDASIQIDLEKDSSITFSWSPSTAADGGLVLYRVLFDVEGGSFEEPIYTASSNNNGAANMLTLSPAYLNIIASRAGVNQLQTGKVIWTVEASVGYQAHQYTENRALSLTRPEGLAEFPPFMYLYGTATEAADIAGGVAFKELTNELPSDAFTPGVFESVTYLKAGEYFIADANNADSTVNYYHMNEAGRIRSGEQPTAFTLPEGVYRVRMNLSSATISFEAMADMELYLIASQSAKAALTYVGNHTFEATQAYADFLVPGAPDAPDWLGWEEERYRFRFMVGDQLSYIGSYHNADMNGSLVEGQEVFNARPNGSESDGYYYTYFLGPEADFWQGAWKFADRFNGASFTIRVVFDPKADHYYHELELN